MAKKNDKRKTYKPTIQDAHYLLGFLSERAFTSFVTRFALELAADDPVQAARATGQECAKDLPGLYTALFDMLEDDAMAQGEVALMLEMIRAAEHDAAVNALFLRHPDAERIVRSDRAHENRLAQARALLAAHSERGAGRDE